MKNDLAQNIRVFRKEKGLTQEQLAEVFDVTVGAIHKWEAGLSTPDVSVLMELADFFDISMDTLLGFDLRDNRVKELAKRLRNMTDRMEKDGLQEAEKALLKYPHSIEVVHEAAYMYQAFASTIADKEKYFRRAKELYELAIRLLPSGCSDPWINDTVLYGGLASTILAMGDVEEAVKILKAHNAGGAFNATIGNILAGQKDTKEADTFLSYGLIIQLGRYMNLVVGKVLFYLNTKQYQEAKDVTLWAIDTLSHLRKEDKPCYIDKLECIALCGLAMAELKMKKKAEAKKILQKAKEKADFFDSAPDYNGQSLRFVSITEKCELYDMSGDKTAKESIGDVISQLEDTELQSIWKSINK